MVANAPEDPPPNREHIAAGSAPMAGPAVLGRRIDELDALRGFALFGILVVNIQAFASAYYGSGIADPHFTAPLDQAARWMIAWLFETKFYLLFSWLFGYSLWLQIGAAERATQPARPRIARRQLSLLGLGLMHGTLLYPGDILTTYAVLGWLLFLVRNWSDRRALRWAGALVGLSVVLLALLGALWWWLDGELDEALTTQAEVEAVETALRGSPREVALQSARIWPEVLGAIIVVQAPSAAAMFLLGLVAGRHRLGERLGEFQRALRRARGWALPLGLAGTAVYATATVFAPGTPSEVLGLALDLLAAPLVSAGYAATLALAAPSAGGRALLGWLAPAGRLALSNYLGQSLACALLFTGYGAGWVGRVSPAGTLLIAGFIYGLQLVLSRLWLRRFVYGPAEWLLRAITLAQWPPLARGTRGE